MHLGWKDPNSELFFWRSLLFNGSASPHSDYTRVTFSSLEVGLKHVQYKIFSNWLCDLSHLRWFCSKWIHVWFTHQTLLKIKLICRHLYFRRKLELCITNMFNNRRNWIQFQYLAFFKTHKPSFTFRLWKSWIFSVTRRSKSDRSKSLSGR